MVPLGTLVKVTETHGPDRAMRYNGYPAAEINGGPAPGFSSGQAEALMTQTRRRQFAERHGDGMDRSDVSTNPRGQHRHLRLSALPAAGVPGAGGAIRKLPPAARDHSDRADVPALRHRGRLAQRQRQQHLYPDRLDRAGGAGVQERDSDRRICQAQTGRRHDRRPKRRSKRAACACARS